MIRHLIGLYPAAWRARYGDELADLVADLPPSASVAVDLLRGAARAHLLAFAAHLAPRLAGAGGPPMPPHVLQRHSTASALIGLAVMAPTAIFVGLSILAYELALPGVAAWVDPGMAALQRAPFIVELFLLAAPFVALLLAVAPMVGLVASRADGELRLTFGLRARVLNLLVLVAALLVGSVLTVYLVSEFLLER